MGGLGAVGAPAALAALAPAALALAVASCMPPVHERDDSAGQDGDDVVLEGRVFWDRTSQDGVDQAFVRIVDWNKRRICFVTSCDGSFVVRRDQHPNLRFPLLVSVERVDDPDAEPEKQRSIAVRRMGTTIGRQRSCGGCHAPGAPTSASPGQIALFDDGSFGARPPLTVPCTTREPITTACPEDR